MRNKCLLTLCIIFIMISLTACNDGKSESKTLDIIGVHRDEVIQILGEPSGMLFGFFGDIYILENGTSITVYYDNETQEVTNVKVFDKDHKVTTSIE